MRVLIETLACSLETAKFPNRRTGQIDEVPFLQVSGVDQDYMDSLLKVKIFKPKDLNRRFQKGDLLQVRFRQMKYSDFDKAVVINANEDDVQVYSSSAAKAGERMAVVA